MLRVQGLFLTIILMGGFTARAELFATYDPYYGEKRLGEYVNVYNAQPHLQSERVKRLKSYYTNPVDKKYFDGENRRWTKKLNPSLLIEDKAITLNIDGRKIARLDQVDPVASTIRINGQDVSIGDDRFAAKILIDINNALRDAGPDKTQVSLFVILPLALDFIGLTFEASLYKVTKAVCQRPEDNYLKKYPFETHWLMKLKGVLVPSAKVVRTCDYWAELEIAQGRKQAAERLTLLCAEGRKALSCATESPLTPFGIKKK